MGNADRINESAMDKNPPDTERSEGLSLTALSLRQGVGPSTVLADRGTDITSTKLSATLKDSTSPLEADSVAAPSTGAMSRFLSSANDSFKYSFVQAPVTAVAQLGDAALKANLEDRWKVFKQNGENHEFGSADWLGNVAGSVAATSLQIGLLYRFVGPGAAAKLERSVNYGLSLQNMAKGTIGSAVKESGLYRHMDPKLASSLTNTRLSDTALPYLGKSFATGAVVGGVFTPNSEHSQNMLSERLQNSAISGLAFSATTAAAMQLKTLGWAPLRSDVLSGTLAAGVGGEVEADGRSLLQTGRFASSEDRLKTVATFMVGGAFGGALNATHEYINPTTGVRGVRTLQDAIDLADSTRLPNYKDIQRKPLAPVPPTAEELIASGKDLTWYEKTYVSLRNNLDDSGLPMDVKKDLMRDLQSTLDAARATHGPENNQKVITVWGGVRPDATDFDFHMARAFGGLAARNGYAIMTGGAQKPGIAGGSIMEAANQGAFEAGGRSIGVVVRKIKREKTTANPWLTEIHYHSNFPPRMTQLRSGDHHVLFKGGIGSLEEFYNKSVHQQVAKEPDGPIYVASKNLYDDTFKQLEKMEGQGLVNQRDVDRFTHKVDPRRIMQDIVRRQAIEDGQQPAAPTGIDGWKQRAADYLRTSNLLH